MLRINTRFINPRLTTDDELFARVVRCQAESAVLVNRVFLSDNPSTPTLYTSGVRYVNEPLGSIDELVDIPAIIKRGWGDCFHLASWRVAELRQMGEDKATIKLTFKRVSRNGRKGRLFHVLVRRQDGSLEDPSRLLGMGR